MTREVMQQALEALENAVRYHGIMLMSDPPQAAWKYYRVEDNAKQAITAIKEALAQPVQPEAKVQNTEDAANEAAAKALYETWHSQPGYLPWQDGGNSHKQDEARELVRLAAHNLKPPLPVQEPVAWTTMPEADDWDFVSGNKDPTGKLEGKWFPLYTTPPAAQRKPLTDEEIDALANNNGTVDLVTWWRQLARAIEAAHNIKEKTND